MVHGPQKQLAPPPSNAADLPNATKPNATCTRSRSRHSPREPDIMHEHKARQQPKGPKGRDRRSDNDGQRARRPARRIRGRDRRRFRAMKRALGPELVLHHRGATETTETTEKPHRRDARERARWELRCASMRRNDTKRAHVSSCMRFPHLGEAMMSMVNRTIEGFGMSDSRRWRLQQMGVDKG